MLEKWLPVKGNEAYEVSNYGSVRNASTKNILKTDCTSRGYLRVKLRENGVSTNQYIHRLVVATFFDCDVQGLRITHKDGDRTNNFVGNLDIL